MDIFGSYCWREFTVTYYFIRFHLSREIPKRQKIFPEEKQGDVWKVIAKNGLNNNLDYSAYNFRSKKKKIHIMNLAFFFRLYQASIMKIR